MLGFSRKHQKENVVKTFLKSAQGLDILISQPAYVTQVIHRFDSTSESQIVYTKLLYVQNQSSRDTCIRSAVLIHRTSHQASDTLLSLHLHKESPFRTSLPRPSMLFKASLVLRSRHWQPDSSPADFLMPIIGFLPLFNANHTCTHQHNVHSCQCTDRHLMSSI